MMAIACRSSPGGDDSHEAMPDWIACDLPGDLEGVAICGYILGSGSFSGSEHSCTDARGGQYSAAHH